MIQKKNTSTSLEQILFSEYFLFIDGEHRIQKANSILLSKLYLNLALLLCHCLEFKVQKSECITQAIGTSHQVYITVLSEPGGDTIFCKEVSFGQHDNEVLSDLILTRQPEVTCYLSIVLSLFSASTFFKGSNFNQLALCSLFLLFFGPYLSTNILFCLVH